MLLSTGQKPNASSSALCLSSTHRQKYLPGSPAVRHLKRRRPHPSPEPLVQKLERHLSLTVLQADPAIFVSIVQILESVSDLGMSLPIGNQINVPVCPVVHLKSRLQSVDESHVTANEDLHLAFSVVHAERKIFSELLHSVMAPRLAAGMSPMGIHAISSAAPLPAPLPPMPEPALLFIAGAPTIPALFCAELSGLPCCTVPTVFEFSPEAVLTEASEAPRLVPCSSLWELTPGAAPRQPLTPNGEAKNSNNSHDFILTSFRIALRIE
jgi:hypothetical protein